MLEALRCKIDLYDEDGFKVFWGMIEGVTVRVDSMEISVSLRHMANKVAVEFNNLVPGQATVGETEITDWTTDQTSIDVFGTKELKQLLNDATTSMAEQTRDRILEEKTVSEPFSSSTMLCLCLPACMK